MQAKQYKHTIVKIRTGRYRGRLYFRTVTDTGETSDWYHIWSYDGYTRRGTRRHMLRKSVELRKVDRFDMRHPVNPPKENK